MYRGFIKTIFLIFLSVIFIPGCRKKNFPPYNPYTPIGTSTGRTGFLYSFSSMAIDPDGDSVALRFYWDDGDTSSWSKLYTSEEIIYMKHSWSFPNIYYIKVQAKDENENTSEWSMPLMVDIVKNSQPVASTPAGPSIGWVNNDYNFLTFASDPESDSVAVRFDWGNGDTSEWSNWMQSGGWTNIYYSWEDPDTYDVRVQAKDFYGITSNWSEPASIIIGAVVWICATPSAAWSRRESHASVVFDNKMWIIGGNNCPDEVWSSPDGVNWTCVTDSAGFGDRDDHRAIVFDNKIWVIAGSQWNPQNDVWCSSDGVNWTCMTNSAQWSPRWDHSVVVFDNKIWVLGGTDLNRGFNDVWYSADGVNWICAAETTPWRQRQNHTSVVFDNKIWVISGQHTHGDVWYSPNGSDWYFSFQSYHLSRQWHTSVVFDNKIWVIGGRRDLYDRNDVWYSSDGVEWVEESTAQPFNKKSDHTSVVFDNKIWVMGGFGKGGMCNDVWYRIVKYSK